MDRAMDYLQKINAPARTGLPEPAIERMEGISLKLAAVISAAVAASMGKPASEYRLTGIQRLDSLSTPRNEWSHAGRLEIIDTRQNFYQRRGK